MAQNSEFYLPPQFLTDGEKRFVNHLFTTSKNDDVFNGFSTTLFPYFFSPTETETKSDENDEYINELTRRMANSTLQHQLALKNKISPPQSTINAFDNGGFGNGIRRNDAVLNLNSLRATNDLLHADAGKVERIHQVSNEEAFYGFVPKKPSVFHTQNHHLSISQKQLQSELQKAQMLKKQWLKQREELAHGCSVFSQRQSRCNYQNVPRRGTDNETVFPGKVGLSPSAWPSVQKIGNYNKSAFPGNPNLKTERNGTGVFLPRFVDTESSRKKSGSRNVVVPERVVHALNRKVDEGVIRGYMQQKNRFQGTSNFENGFGVVKNGSHDDFLSQKQAEVNSEIQLPQEWTY